MTSMQDIESLKQGLVSDLAQAEGQATKGAAARGGAEDSSFKAKALRIKNRAFGQAELAAVNEGIEKAVKALSAESSFADEAEAKIFESKARKKMHQYKMHLMKQAGEFNMSMASKRADQAKRQAMLAALSGVVSGGTELAVSKWKKSEPNTEVTYGSPSQGSALGVYDAPPAGGNIFGVSRNPTGGSSGGF